MLREMDRLFLGTRENRFRCMIKRGPDLVLPQRKENTIPVRRPRRVIRVVAGDILGNRGLATGDIRDGDVADIGSCRSFFPQC